ncbi:MAG TPA: ABC transporter permease [Acidimicrobiia bacterium]|nr:ABC transporter permease [Acidimicrobiia bacterium]
MSLASPFSSNPPVPIGEELPVDDDVVGESRGRFWRRFFATKTAVFGLAFLVIIGLAAIFASVIAPHSPNQNFPVINGTPSSAHWLGTDDLGRDILSRIIYGGQISLQATVQIVFLAVIVSLPLGLIAGYFGGWRDHLLMRIMDALFAFPPLVLALTVAALLGASLVNESIAIAVVFVPGFVRLIRGQVLAVREETYIEASRSLGAGSWRMLRKHVLPNVASPLIVQVALALGYGLLAEAGLSFLGLGVQPPRASWGGMLSEAYTYVLNDAWALVVPGVAIALTVLSFNLVADGLRDSLGRERFTGRE